MRAAPWYQWAGSDAEIPSNALQMWAAENGTSLLAGAMLSRFDRGVRVCTVKLSGDRLVVVWGADYDDVRALVESAPDWHHKDFVIPGLSGPPPKVPLIGLIDAALLTCGHAIEVREGATDTAGVLTAAFQRLSRVPEVGGLKVASLPANPGVLMIWREGDWEVIERPLNVGGKALRVKVSNTEVLEIRRSAPRGTQYVCELFRTSDNARTVQMEAERTVEAAIASLLAEHRSHVSRSIGTPSAGVLAAFMAGPEVAEGGWSLVGSVLRTTVPDGGEVRLEAANDRSLSASYWKDGAVVSDVMGPNPETAIVALRERLRQRGVAYNLAVSALPAGVLAKFLDKIQFPNNNPSPENKTMANGNETPSTFGVVQTAYKTAAIGKAVTATERKILDLVKSKLRQAYPTLPDHEGYDRLILTVIPIAIRELCLRAPESVPESVRKYGVVGADAAIFFDAVKNVDDLGNMLAQVGGEVLEMMSGLGQMASMANGAGGMFGALEDKSGIVNLEERTKEKVRATGGSGSGSIGG